MNPLGRSLHDVGLSYLVSCTNMYAIVLGDLKLFLSSAAASNTFA